MQTDFRFQTDIWAEKMMYGVYLTRNKTESEETKMTQWYELAYSGCGMDGGMWKAL